METDAKIIELIKSAINNNRIDEARSLLRPLMQRNVTEAFYLASRVAYTQEQALEFLRYALELDPENTQVKDALSELETLYANQTNLVIADPNVVSKSDDSKEKINQTVALFQHYGWKVISQGDDNAQFVRRNTMSPLNAFILGVSMHIFGLVLVIILLLSAERIHAFVEAEEDELFLSTSKGEMLLHRPQQALIMLDKTNGVSYLSGILWTIFGIVITTLIFAFLIWQMNQFRLDAWIEPLLTPPFYPDA